MIINEVLFVITMSVMFASINIWIHSILESKFDKTLINYIDKIFAIISAVTIVILYTSIFGPSGGN